jgi:osmoprotectant transport system permease protein
MSFPGSLSGYLPGPLPRPNAGRPALALPADAPNPWFSWHYIQQNADQILTYLQFHFVTTIEAVAAAMIVAIPLAVLCYWVKPLAAPILALSGVLYTIPSLALFAFLAPFVGVGVTTILIGLVLYALLLMIQNTLTGLRQVPDEVRDAARGMGYGRVGMLWHVELPLALPGIITGIRLATVSTVALLTVGVIVGQGGLGQLISSGLHTNLNKAAILTGTLLCVALGLALDLVIAGIGWIVTPWARRRVAS